MPYIHWESDRAQRKIAALIEEVKEESQRTTGAKKNNFWPNENHHPRKSSATINHTGQPDKGKMKTQDLDHAMLDTPEAQEDYAELLRRYLYKRRPVHLRRTLDQYYYSHLADTNFRDGDQVVMRQLNEYKKRLQMEGDPKYIELLRIKKTEEDISKASLLPRIMKKVSTSRPKNLKEIESKLNEIEQRPYRDDNSPVLMVDQLWLWVIDESLLFII
jgi:hypothetical protein